MRFLASEALARETDYFNWLIETKENLNGRQNVPADCWRKNVDSGVLKMVDMEDLKEDFPSKSSVQLSYTCRFCNKTVLVN